MKTSSCRMRSSGDPVGGSRGHITFRSKVLAQESMQWVLVYQWDGLMVWAVRALVPHCTEKLTEARRIAAGRKQTLSDCPLPCRCRDDSHGDADGDNGEEGKNNHKGYIYRTTPPLLPAGGWTTVSHFTVEGSGSQKEHRCRGSS